MFKNKVFLFTIGIAVLAMVVSMIISADLSQPEPVQTQESIYDIGIKDFRSNKDASMKNSKDSPIEDKENFKGLNYFGVDAKFKVIAQLDRFKTGQKFTVSMSGGETEEYEPFGNATFEIDGLKCALKLFKSENNLLFVPFKDKTNGTETYGGGRYLDVEMTAINGTEIELDFNKSYLPFCAYNHSFTCPVPPTENSLQIAVKAGEKLN
jgi:uncharacterized protein